MTYTDSPSPVIPFMRTYPPSPRRGRFGLWLLLCMVGFKASASHLAPVVSGTPWLARGHLPHPGRDHGGVTEAELSVRHRGEKLDFTLYRPDPVGAKAPAVVFLPGLMADVDQYASYARALASRGIVVAVHEWYSPFTSDLELAKNARVLADWLVNTLGVDRHRIGAAGHSMGAKDAMLAAGAYGGFAGIVAIDPDDSGEVSVVREYMSQLRAPLLLIGAEVAWQAPSICAPMEANYQRYFERAPRGTVELTLRDADHVQMLDDPERFGYTICRCGSADSGRVHDTALAATVAFFVQHLLGGPAAIYDFPAELVSLRVMPGNGRAVALSLAGGLDKPVP